MGMLRTVHTVWLSIAVAGRCTVDTRTACPITLLKVCLPDKPRADLCRQRNDRLREIAQRKRRLMREAGVMDPLLRASPSPSHFSASSSSSSSSSSSQDGSEAGDGSSMHIESMPCVCDHLDSPGAQSVQVVQGRVGVSAQGYQLLQQRLQELNQ